MVSFLLSLGLLVAGYCLYGRFVEKQVAIGDEQTVAFTKEDGVDFVPLPTWKAFFIQLLDIAGTGPIFGAIMGAVFGPIVFIWIVLGSILGGAVHDFLTGYISLKHEGETIVRLAGLYIGRVILWFMRVFSVLLLVLVGTVFVSAPATLIQMLTPINDTAVFWVVVLIAYYFLATVFPIDKVIGRIYPVFGILLSAMVILVGIGLFTKGLSIPEIDLINHHAQDLPVWPFMFITVACGAVSGFHATQSPLMARCVKSQRDCRKVFYGAMIAEGAIALVWAAAGMAFYGDSASLQNAIMSLGQSGVVYQISFGLMGTLGAVLAVIGVVICPISSGDTAFRCARLILAEWFHIDQTKLRNRLALAIPLLAAGALLTQVDFDALWRYFAWSNQVLAMIVLWMGAVFLFRQGTHKWSFLIAAIPAAFMSAVTSTYILMAAEGFGLSAAIAYPCGIAFAVFCAVLFGRFVLKQRKRLRASD